MQGASGVANEARSAKRHVCRIASYGKNHHEQANYDARDDEARFLVEEFHVFSFLSVPHCGQGEAFARMQRGKWVVRAERGCCRVQKWGLTQDKHPRAEINPR